MTSAVAAMTIAVAERFARADRAVMAAVPGCRNRRAVTAALAVSAMAEPTVAGSVLVAAALIGATRDGWPTAALPLVAVPCGLAARRLFCDLIGRPRPPQGNWLVKPTGYSLPSRHATVAALTAGACFSAAGSANLPRHAMPLVAAAAVGASRVYLGVHWPTDVLAGWVFAEAWLALAEPVLRNALPVSQARSGSVETREEPT